MFNYQEVPAGDDDDLDLFGDETEEDKKAAEEREAAKKSSAKKKESMYMCGYRYRQFAILATKEYRMNK